MKSVTRSLFILTLACVPAVFAQKWELGGGAGFGFYTSQDITGTGGSGSAKFASNVAASAWVANNNREFLGGELRYDYQRGDAQLSSSGTTAKFAAQTHTIHYDFHYHFAPRNSPVRPFVAAGAGIKVYQGTGKEVVYQPLSNIGLLTKTNDVRPVVSVGAGIKFKVSKSLGFRAEVHDYLTPFPKNVIAPSLNQKASGWLQDLVVSFGVSYLF